MSSSAVPVGLPTRVDPVITFELMLTTVMATAFLLLAAYIALRMYAAWGRKKALSPAVAAVTCESRVRLSAKTTVYLLDVKGEQILLVESHQPVSIRSLCGRQLSEITGHEKN